MMPKQYNLVIILFAVLSLGSCGNKSIHNRNRVKKGEFKVSITESGDLQAINSKVISMPFVGGKYGWRWQIINLEEHGKSVKRGEIVVVIDDSPVLKILEQEKNKLETELANLEKLHVTNNSQITQIQSDYNSEKSNYELIKLQVDKFKFEPEKKQLIKQKELEIAIIKLERIKNKLELRQEVFQNEMKIQQIKIEQIKKNVSEAEEALLKLNLTSPIDGIFQLDRNRRTNKTMQIGDQIHMGQIIARIPDMSRMKVISTINEADISKINLNQEVIIRLDAYPEKIFGGKISYIGKLSREKDKNNPVKVFDLEILVNDSDPALKPGMTVSCEILIQNFEDVLYIENDCIFQDTSQFYVCAKKTGGVEIIPVNIIARNNQFTALDGDIDKGQKLLVKNELIAQ